MFFKTTCNYRLMQDKSIAECSFQPSLSYHMSLRLLLKDCLFLSDCFTQVLLYSQFSAKNVDFLFTDLKRDSPTSQM